MVKKENDGSTIPSWSRQDQTWWTKGYTSTKHIHWGQPTSKDNRRSFEHTHYLYSNHKTSAEKKDTKKRGCAIGGGFCTDGRLNQEKKDLQSVTCYHCSEKSHYTRNCKKREKEQIMLMRQVVVKMKAMKWCTYFIKTSLQFSVALGSCWISKVLWISLLTQNI